MAHPENQPPDEEDGGTFKLKPGGGKSSPEAPGPDNMESTMKLRKVGGGNPAASSGPPPPPASPLGNPTGPAAPPQPFAETTVMPQSGGSQTGFQPGQQQPPQQPGGQPQQPPQPGQQYGRQPPYGQQPPGGQLPPQGQMPPQGQPYGQPGGVPGAVPEGVKRIGMVAMIGAGVGIVGSILGLVLIGGVVIFSEAVGILLALAFGYWGFSLPRGQIKSPGLRLTGVILIMIAAGLSLLSVLGGLSAMSLVGGIVVVPMLINLALAGLYGYASFIYFRNEDVKAFIKGAPAAGQQPGYPPQPGQQPQQQHGQPGGYPPPPGQQGYPQQGQQPPYGR